MKKIFLLFLTFLLVSLNGMAQSADKPELMVIPSDNWFYSNGYFKTVTVNGAQKRLPDWERAFTENPDLNNVLTTIAQMFIDRGFTVTNVWDEMKSLEEEAAEDMAMEADGDGDASSTSTLDQVLTQIKPDIKLEINWQVNQLGFQKSVFVNIDGKDSYTNKTIAPMQRQSDGMPSSTQLTIMLKQAVEGGFEQLSNNLMTYFTSLSQKGREIRMAVRVTQNSSVDLFSSVGSSRLNAAIQDWVRQHSKNGTGTLAPGSTKNKMNFRGIKIPLQDANGVKMDASEWARVEGLEQYLKSLNVPARVDNQGLGSIIVRIGAN